MLSDEVESWRSGCETRSVARSRRYSSSRFNGASFGAERERNSSALACVPAWPSADVGVQPTAQVLLGIGGGREDQPELVLPPEQAVGEQLAEHEGRAHLVGAAIVHAHHAVDRREVGLHHQLECVAHRGVPARAGRDRQARDLPHRAQRLRHVVLAQRARAFEAAPMSSSCARVTACVAFEHDVRHLRLEQLHAQHAAAGQRVVEPDLGPHESVPLVERQQARRRWRARCRARSAGRAARGRPRTAAPRRRPCCRRRPRW